jgi:hypothetical protein
VGSDVTLMNWWSQGYEAFSVSGPTWDKLKIEGEDDFPSLRRH